MPLISSKYSGPPFYLYNGHLETIIPSMFFKVKEELYTRERLELPDGDFIDLDWINSSNDRCIILSHGLEGGTDRYYMKRAAKYFGQRNWDIAAWNCRSCSGEMNRLPRFYHHGDTQDLSYVIDQVLSLGYKQVVLMGYSMGGSMSLKYLGERKNREEILGGVFYSVPCNLEDSAVQLRLKENRMYEQRFLKKLVNKIRIKSEMHDEVDAYKLDQIEDFDAFHDHYTAPLHGFESKKEFFDAATCDQYFPGVDRPVLIVNALNDPMLGEACYPREQAEANPMLHLEIPKRGGHVGFTTSVFGSSYMESRAQEFIEEMLL